MKNFIIYVFLLFLLFIPNFIIKVPFLKNDMLKRFFLGLVFSFFVGIGHGFFLDQKQGFVIEMESKDGEHPLGKLVTSFMNSKTPAKTRVRNYQINNDIDLSDPTLLQENGDQQLLKNKEEEEKINKNIQAKKEDQNGKENIGWVLSPIVQEEKYERRKQKGLYCAADFNTTTTCCDQPLSDVSEEYVCPEETPKCINYVAHEKWGTCSN